ncbi:hypothetical protein CASFOL_004044 [Castilleja foliolosa]|uniref:Transmembrane protein n=1 Tax=Castilleja foliolosa TaxID=1961234 RepID=A0ABD3EJ98_9LAMI
MASSSSYWLTLISLWKINFALIFIFILLISTLNCCNAIRVRRAKIVEDDDVSLIKKLEYFAENEKVTADHGLYFTMLPKGVPIPPSAPSKGHNSSPQNR